VRGARLGPGVESPGHTILVVDDDPSIRFLCRLNLELDGYTVLEAGTIDEARAGLPDTDVVLLDVHVGTASGIEFLEEIRADFPELRVALLTGAADQPPDSDAVIPKPFTIEQLTRTVRGLAARNANTAG
jgi:DNA-binding response OmpR family regulator